MKLLQILQPSYWFAAHMHARFPAIFPHDDAGNTTSINNTSNDTINNVNDGQTEEMTTTTTTTTTLTTKPRKETKFLALGKVNPRADFLQVHHFPPLPRFSLALSNPVYLYTHPQIHSLLAMQVLDVRTEQEQSINNTDITSTSGIDVAADTAVTRLYYDVEWLIISATTRSLYSTSAYNVNLPNSNSSQR